jgi:hypothetical protein
MTVPGMFRLTLATIGAACALASPGWGQAEGPGRGFLKTRELEVTIALEKSELTVGDPLVFAINIRRIGGNTPMVQVGSRMFFPAGNDLTVMIERSDEPEYQAEGSMDRTAYARFASDLPMHGSIDIVRSLLFERRHPSGFLLDKPGTYRLNARLRLLVNTVDNIEVVMPNTLLKVKAAEGDAAKAFAMLSKPNIAKSLEQERATDQESAKVLREAVEKYLDTPYGERCLKTVAMTACSGERPDYDAAIPLLKRFIEKYPKSSSADEVANALSGAFHMKGDRDTASLWVAYLLFKYPTSIFLRTQNPLYRYYVEEPTEMVSKGPWYLSEKPWIDPRAKVPTDLNIQTSPNR